MSNTDTYVSEIEIPQEWIKRLESKPDISERERKNRESAAFIKKYYGVYSNVDIIETLGVCERSYYKRIKRMKKRGEL